MSSEILLLVLTIGVSLWASSRLYLKNKKSDSDKIQGSELSAYTNLGYFSRLFRLFSINAKPGICVSILFLLSLAVSFLVAEIVQLGAIEIGIAALLLTLTVMYALKEFAAKKRRKFETGLVEAIEIMQAASMSGATPQSALQAVADTCTGDVQKEFRIMVRSLQYGSSIESAVARIAVLYDSEGARMLTQVLIAKWNIGGNLEELMGSVARMIRERISMRMQIAGKLSGAKYASMFMGVAPYLLIPYFLSAEPMWLQTFLTHPAGVTVFSFALVLQLVGFVWLRKVLRIKL